MEKKPEERPRNKNEFTWASLVRGEDPAFCFFQNKIKIPVYVNLLIKEDLNNLLGTHEHFQGQGLYM